MGFLSISLASFLLFNIVCMIRVEAFPLDTFSAAGSVKTWCDETGCHTAFVPDNEAMPAASFSGSGNAYAGAKDGKAFSTADGEHFNVAGGGVAFTSGGNKAKTVGNGASSSSTSSGGGHATSWSSSTDDKGTSFTSSKTGPDGVPKTYTHTTGNGKAQSFAGSTNGGKESKSFSSSDSNGKGDPKTVAKATGTGKAAAVAVNADGKVSKTDSDDDRLKRESSTKEPDFFPDFVTEIVTSGEGKKWTLKTAPGMGPIVPPPMLKPATLPVIIMPYGSRPPGFGPDVIIPGSRGVRSSSSSGSGSWPGARSSSSSGSWPGASSSSSSGSGSWDGARSSASSYAGPGIRPGAWSSASSGRPGKFDNFKYPEWW